MYGMLRFADIESLLDLIWDRARSGDLGEPMMVFCSSSVRLRQIRSAAWQIIERTMGMPQGPNLRQRELGQHYLDEYARWGGDPPLLPVFFDEMRVLWFAGELRYLDWNLTRGLPGSV